MFTLSELFDNLAKSELSQLHIGNSQLDTIDEEHYPQMVVHVNAALEALSKRFDIIEKSHIVHQVTDLTDYYMESRYADYEEYCGNIYTYIRITDTNPFLDDLVKITKVEDEDGEEMGLNDRTDTDSVYTPQYNLLRMTPSTPLQNVTVTYRATYPLIVIDENFDPAKEEISLPRYLQEAFNLRIAHQISRARHTSSAEGETNPATTFLNRYELACRDVEKYNVTPDDNTPNEKPDLRGYP